MKPITRQALRVLDVLKAAGRPLGTATIIERTVGDTHLSWKALKALTACGRVQCDVVQPNKTGRPQKVYSVGTMTDEPKQTSWWLNKPEREGR